MSQELLKNALSTYKKLKAAKELVRHLEKELSTDKDKIQVVMRVEGTKLFECSEGYARWVDRKGAVKWDVEALEKRLGEEVNNFRKVSADSRYIKFGLYGDLTSEKNYG
jgi:hypothetical protein